MRSWDIVEDWQEVKFFSKEKNEYVEFSYPIITAYVMAKNEALAIFCACELRLEEFEIEPCVGRPKFSLSLANDMKREERLNSHFYKSLYN